MSTATATARKESTMTTDPPSQHGYEDNRLVNVLNHLKSTTLFNDLLTSAQVSIKVSYVLLLELEI